MAATSRCLRVLTVPGKGWIGGEIDVALAKRDELAHSEASISEQRDDGLLSSMPPSRLPVKEARRAPLSPRLQVIPPECPRG